MKKIVATFLTVIMLVSLIPTATMTAAAASTYPEKYADLYNFENGNIAFSSKADHLSSISLDETNGIDSSKAAKLTFKSIPYVPNDDNFTINISPEQRAKSIGMRFWLKGKTEDYNRRHMVFTTTDLQSGATKHLL